MQAAEIRKVWEAVDRFLAEHRGDAVLVPEQFSVLFKNIRAQDLGWPHDENLLKLVTAVCALGFGRTPPPETIISDLQQITGSAPGAGPNSIFDVVVAYGCGKWRTLKPGGNSWEGEWPGATLTLIHAIEIPVREVLTWLAQHLYGFPKLSYWNSQEGKDFIGRDSACLATYLVRPELSAHFSKDVVWAVHVPAAEEGAVLSMEPGGPVKHVPPGSRAVYETCTPALLRARRAADGDTQQLLPGGTRLKVLAQDDNVRIMLPAPLRDLTLKPGDYVFIEGPSELNNLICACGNTNCSTRHRLSAWDPLKFSLQSFISSAVKGPDTEIRLGSVITGMYFPLLASDGAGESVRLRKALVEFKVCQAQNCASQEPPPKYEGDRCPSCRSPFDPATTLRVGIDRLIAVPDVPLYAREARFHCLGTRAIGNTLQACDNLYETEACPLCGTRPKMRKATHVWVWNGYTKVSLDDNRLGERDPLSWAESCEGEDTAHDSGRPDDDAFLDNDADEDN